MAKKDEWMFYALAGLAGIAGLAYFFMTSQKAGAPAMGQQPQPQQGIAVGEPNPSAPKEGGCGCGMEPQSHAEASSVVGTPGT